MAGVFDRRNLHPQANPHVWDVIFAGVLRRRDHPFDPPAAKATRHQDPIVAAQDLSYVVRRNRFGVKVVDFHLGVHRIAGVPQGFVYRNVGVLQVRVLPNHRNLNRFGQFIFNVVDHLGPFPHVGRWDV